jgi:chemotaxis protein CheD
VAVQRLIADLLALGCEKRNLQAKVFGGASVIGAFRDARNQLGMKNIQIALDLLATAGIPVIAEDVGGQRGRKVIFQTHDGTAWVRRL